MHKNPYKHRFIAGSSKYSTKPLSTRLTNLLTHIKQGFQKYFETSYSRSGINQMWILENSKELLENLKYPIFNHKQASSLLILPHFIQRYITRNWKKHTHYYHPNRLRERRNIFFEGAFWFLKQVLWRWNHQDAWVSSWQDFRGFCRKIIPADSRHSNGHELCSSSRRHLSGFIRSGMHTVFAPNGKETVSISFQSHLQVHQLCKFMSINNP